MNIANINWIDIKNKLDFTEDSQVDIGKKKTGSTKRIYTLELLVPGCLNVFWDKVFQVLASVEPIKIDDSYSPLATMKSIPEIIKTPYGDISKDNYKAVVVSCI